MRVFPEHRYRSHRGRSVILTPGAEEFSASSVVTRMGGITSAAWTSANDPLALPFVLPNGGTVYQLGWYNGSSAGDNVDMGIYDTGFNRKVSTGSTLASGSSVLQWVDVTDTSLAPGRYFAVMARDTTTLNRVTYYTSLLATASMALMGCQDSTTDAFPLPDPLTNMAVATTFTRVPVMQMALKIPA